MALVSQQNVVELAANAVRTETFTGSAVDIRDYEGMAHFVLQSSAATAGTSPTLNVKLTHSATSDGTYTDVAGGSFAELTDAADGTEMISVNVDGMNRFVKLVGTVGGTSTPTFGFGVSMIGSLKSGRNSSQAV